MLGNTARGHFSAQFLLSQQDRCKAYLDRASFLSSGTRSGVAEWGGGGGGKIPPSPQTKPWKYKIYASENLKIDIRSEDVSFEVATRINDVIQGGNCVIVLIFPKLQENAEIEQKVIKTRKGKIISA